MVLFALRLLAELLLTFDLTIGQTRGQNICSGFITVYLQKSYILVRYSGG